MAKKKKKEYIPMGIMPAERELESKASYSGFSMLPLGVVQEPKKKKKVKVVEFVKRRRYRIDVAVARQNAMMRLQMMRESSEERKPLVRISSDELKKRLEANKEWLAARRELKASENVTTRFFYKPKRK